MGAVGIRFRAELRARWRSWALIALFGGIAGAFVLAFWAGADRTSRAYPRYLTASNAADAYVDPGIGFGDESLDLRRVARLPQIAHAEESLVLAVISRSRSGRPVYPIGPDAVQYQVPSDGRLADRIDKQKIIEGRLPDPARADEALGDTKSMRSLGLHVGDSLTVRMISQRVLRSKTAVIHGSADPLTARVGRLLKFRIVGVAANARSDVDGGLVRLSPGAYKRYGEIVLGHVVKELAVRLNRGAADLPGFRAAVHRIAGVRQYGFFEPSEGRPKLQRSVDLQADAMRLLAFVTAIAGALLLGQALLRQAAASLRGQRTLQALGMTSSQLIRVGALRTLAIALPAAGVALAGAFLLSPLAPVGRAREIEPHPGFAFDSSVLLPGAALVLAALVLVGTLGAARVVIYGLGQSPRGSSGAGRSFAAALSRAGSPPALCAGVRMALVRRSRESAVPVRATLVAAVLAVGVAVAAATFAASLQHLLHTPALYGQTWDFETAWGSTIPPPILRQLAREHGVSALAAGAIAPVEVGGREVGARATDNVKGSITAPVLEGRAPRGPGEALLGPKTLDSLHKRIGDTVVVHSGSRSVALRIVGRGILPTTKWNNLGEGLGMSFRSFKRIEPQAGAGTAEIRYARGPARHAAERTAAFLFDGTAAVRPTEVGDFAGVNGMPFIIAALFAGAAIAVLGHALVTSVRRRRRDLAILKTLGFTRGQIAAAVAWQATTIAAIGVLLGAPLGVLVGRFGWNQFAEQLGVVPQAVTPIGVTLLIAPVAILLANAIAAPPGLAAARTRAAPVLRAE